jgi:hemerythrin superfamily protein
MVCCHEFWKWVSKKLREKDEVVDAISLLKADHRTVQQLFKSFEKAGENALKSKQRTVKRMVEELSVHAAIEEQVFYPAVRLEVRDSQDWVLESLEEHHVVKWLCSELVDMDPTDERFDAKVAVLTESVRHHIGEEESQLFPEVRQAMGRKRLSELGEELERAKAKAPRRPHPRVPDTPPGNLIAGVAAAAIDKVREAVAR